VVICGQAVVEGISAVEKRVKVAGKGIKKVLEKEVVKSQSREDTAT